MEKPIETREVFKVVANKNGMLLSAVYHNFPVVYKPKKKITPRYGPSFVFNSLDSAVKFIKNGNIHFSSPNLEIWKAKGEEIKEQRECLFIIFSNCNVDDLLGFWSPSSSSSLLIGSAPIGTLVCKSLSLLEKVA